MGWSSGFTWTYSELGSDIVGSYTNTTSSPKVVRTVSVSLGTGYGQFYAGNSVYGNGYPISIHLACNGVASTSVTVSNVISPTYGYPPRGSGQAYTFTFTNGITVPAGGSVSFSLVWPVGQCLVAFSSTITGTVTEANVTVTFNLNGGTRTGGGALSQSVTVGGSAIAPTCEKAGYTFSGWDKSLTNITSNTTITAQWTLNPVYTITLNANGGSFSTSSLTYRSGIGVPLPTGKPIKSITISFDYVISALTGYNSSTTVSLTFAGWNTKKDGTGTTYQPGATVGGAADMTLYAQYEGVIISLPGLTTNDVATMTGWWTKKSGGTKITTSTKFTASTTVYAQYSDYTIKLHGNGGVITLDESGDDPASIVTVKKIHGTDLVIPDYTAYLTSGEDETASTEFLGWAKSRSATKATYQKGSKYTDDEPTTLYAIYGTKTFTVKWSKGYGTNPIIKTEEVAYGKSATPPADPVRDGYTFGGWLGEYKCIKGDRTIIALWTSTPIWIYNGTTWIGYEPEEV